MNVKLIISFSLLFGLGLQVRAQQISGGLWLYTNPLTNFDIMHMKFNLGLEKMINREGSLTLSGSVYYYNWHFREPNSGYEIEMSYKRRINKKWLYYAPGIRFNHIKYEPDVIAPKNHKIDKFVGEANIQLGFKSFGKRNMFDLFVGTGLRFKNTNYIGGYVSDSQNFNYFAADDQRDKEGFHVIPVLKLGFIVGLRLQ